MELIFLGLKLVVLPIMFLAGVLKMVRGETILGKYSIWPYLEDHLSIRLIGMVEIFGASLIAAYQCESCPTVLLYALIVAFLTSIIAVISVVSSRV